MKTMKTMQAIAVACLLSCVFGCPAKKNQAPTPTPAGTTTPTPTSPPSVVTEPGLAPAKIDASTMVQELKNWSNATGKLSLTQISTHYGNLTSTEKSRLLDLLKQFVSGDLDGFAKRIGSSNVVNSLAKKIKEAFKKDDAEINKLSEATAKSAFTTAKTKYAFFSDTGGELTAKELHTLIASLEVPDLQIIFDVFKEADIASNSGK